MKVAILPTGRTEWHGLAHALQQLFPNHQFYSVPTAAEVESNPNLFPYPGFTSAQLTELQEQSPPESARELVARAAQEALGDRRRDCADHVIIIDDVELLNMTQIPRVARVMRAAVEQHLHELAASTSQPIVERTTQVLREKVSFHLIAPMIEAWFFADPAALATAGVPAATAVHFHGATDPEAFQTNDPSYLTASQNVCTDWCAKGCMKKLRPKWLGTGNRCQHPKGYLQWLCIDPTANNCTSYAESLHGANALANLSWKTVSARQPGQFELLKALVEDLSFGLQTAPAVKLGLPQGTPPTRIGNAPQNRVLRNL